MSTEDSTAAVGGVHRLAVIGTPLGHSRSPLLHRAALSALGLSGWRYDAIETDEAGLRPLLARLGPDWAGLSVTMPCKRAALAAASHASDLAVAVGAANTLLNRREGWYADNTDVAGIVAALAEAGVGDAPDAVVLGAGGTAVAALAALAMLGVRRPRVRVRSSARAEALCDAAKRIGSSPRLSEGGLTADVLDTPLLISALPAHAADPLAQLPWPARSGVVFDVLYDPWPSALAAAAVESGRTVVGGLHLLLHQAERQVELFTGQPAPSAQMRSALFGAR